MENLEPFHPQLTHAQITDITPLTAHILNVKLRPATYIPYVAGQYLKIKSTTGDLCYSIANAPLGAKHYELHIKHIESNTEQQDIIHALKHNETLSLVLPFGGCTLNAIDTSKPLFFIAAGTGFAPIKAMIEQLLFEACDNLIHLFWSASSQEALYLDEQVQSWVRHVAQFNYTPHISQSSDASMATRVIDTLNFQYNSEVEQSAQFVLAGPFGFVYAARDQLCAHGIKPSQMFSDAFEFEPQSK